MNWAAAGQIAVCVVVGVTIIVGFFAYRAAKADEQPYRSRRYIP